MRAFSLIELIFVIVIMGILTFSALEFIPDNTLISDKEMLRLKIMQKKSNALGYKKIGFEDYICITFDKNYLNEEDKNSNEKVHYIFKSDISVEGLSGNRICFDSFGRVYDNEIDDTLENLIENIITIKLIYKNDEKNITIYPLTGAIK